MRQGVWRQECERKQRAGAVKEIELVTCDALVFFLLREKGKLTARVIVRGSIVIN